MVDLCGRHQVYILRVLQGKMWMWMGMPTLTLTPLHIRVVHVSRYVVWERSPTLTGKARLGSSTVLFD